MRTWLRHAGNAALIVSDRADLWLSGALGWLAYGGFLVLICTVVPLPSPLDLAFLGTGFAFTDSILPALAVAGGLFVAFVALLALHALGESVLAAQLDGRRTGWVSAIGGVLGVHIVAAVPVVGAGLVLGWRLGAVAVAEYGSPDIGGSLIFRIVVGVSPELLLLVAVLLLAQVVAAGASWRVAGRARATVVDGLAHGVRDAARAPLPLAATAVASLLAHVLYAVVAFLLLRVLWAPIGAALVVGDIRDPAVPALLVGFVAIWLCLVLGGGALHAWASTWWAAQLDAGAAQAVALPSAERARESQPHEEASRG